ncbi:MAG: RAQPRD family integrative conjugative element protein [Acidiferrobacterales bacterium]|nr:RAQPRD family integrative conjugative element protein [Acidiferrobacterales bacterium]
MNRQFTHSPPTTVAKSNSSIVRQTNSNEKHVLTRVARYLEELNALIDEAEFHAQDDSRIRFDYQQLRLDLSAVTHGIRTHLLVPDYQPRAIEPIPGKYGR